MLALILVQATCLSGGRDSTGRFLSIGTGGTGGIYYPLGGALASRLSVLDSARQFTAEVTGGSVENVNRVARGDVDLGFAIGTTVFEAFHGGPGFERPLDGLRIVAPIYPNVTHVLVGRNSTATSLAGLRDRRVSVGAPGSGTEQMARQLLEAYGITYDDIDVRYLSFRESSDALRDGAIDAAIFSVGYPASAVLEATATGGARLLGISPREGSRLFDQYSYYTAGTIPTGAYPGVSEDVPTIRTMNWIVSTNDLDASVVRHILNILEKERDELAQVNDVARQIDLTRLQSAPIPLHPATERWIRNRVQ